MRKGSYTSHKHFNCAHRFEHWYRDNTVYFITSRCRDKFPAFSTPEATAIFWDRFDHYSKAHGFVPWVTSLLNDHYHTLGYLKKGQELGPMMRKIHGSVAKLVNDLLPVPHLPFWRGVGKQNYFDGCIRDAVQCRRAYRYTMLQRVRHGLCSDYRDYPDMHVAIEFERGLKRALELNAFLANVPYKRYQRRGNGDQHGH